MSDCLSILSGYFVNDSGMIIFFIFQQYYIPEFIQLLYRIAAVDHFVYYNVLLSAMSSPKKKSYKSVMIDKP